MPVELPGPNASNEELRRFALQMQEQARQFSTALETTSQLLAAATTNNGANTRKRKPELPSWDPKNIESWIRRVRAAYTRVGIEDPSDKFAFLENIIPVDTHPSINAYFNGAATPDNWEAFLAFIQKRYGRTKEQQVTTAIEGIRRDGRLPSDLLALLTDQTGKVTMDDILKEHLMREMPPSVRLALAERIKDLTPLEAAAAADKYFNRDGRLLVSAPAINSAEPVIDTTEDEHAVPVLVYVGDQLELSPLILELS